VSAICSIYDVRGQTATGIELAAMMQALTAFGPEGAQVWCTGSVALGHQHRHVTSESQGDIHPWYDATAGLAMTADAGLDNREKRVGFRLVRNITNE
jgi:asparagine synthase (glutamine-hydrolysing)